MHHFHSVLFQRVQTKLLNNLIKTVYIIKEKWCPIHQGIPNSGTLVTQRTEDTSRSSKRKRKKTHPYPFMYQYGQFCFETIVLFWINTIKKKNLWNANSVSLWLTTLSQSKILFSPCKHETSFTWLMIDSQFWVPLYCETRYYESDTELPKVIIHHG